MEILKKQERKRCIYWCYTDFTVGSYFFKVWRDSYKHKKKDNAWNIFLLGASKNDFNLYLSGLFYPKQGM